MPFLFDTDVVIDYLQQETIIHSYLSRPRTVGHAISAITHMEVLDGVLGRTDSAMARADVNVFVTSVAVLPFSLREVERCAQLRTDLRRRKRAIRARFLDLMIAATTISHGLALVTRNVADYRDVPGLVLASPEQLEASQT